MIFLGFVLTLCLIFAVWHVFQLFKPTEQQAALKKVEFGQQEFQYTDYKKTDNSLVGESNGSF